MDVISMRARRRFIQVGLAALIICLTWLTQLTIVSLLPARTVFCSFPLIVTIVWGAVFGSPWQMPSAEELRRVGLGQIVSMQLLSGSVSGALAGAFFASLYASLLPVYPISYPLVGWVAGYFCLRGFNQGTIVCVPLVLLLTVFAESAMAVQLAVLHSRPEVFHHLMQTAVPEAIVNAILSPFIFYPMRTWYEFSKTPTEVVRT